SSISGRLWGRLGVAGRARQSRMRESRAALFATAHELLDIVEQVRPQDLTQADRDLVRRLVRKVRALLGLARGMGGAMEIRSVLCPCGAEMVQSLLARAAGRDLWSVRTVRVGCRSGGWKSMAVAGPTGRTSHRPHADVVVATLARLIATCKPGYRESLL